MRLHQIKNLTENYVWHKFCLIILLKKLEIQYAMEKINTPQVFKVKYDTSEEELLSVDEIKTMETHTDHRDEAIRFFQDLILCSFPSLLFSPVSGFMIQRKPCVRSLSLSDGAW